jgi:hypothetical protein
MDIEPERVDSETIVVLLHLRKLLKELRETGREVETKLITEVLDSSNRELAEHAGVNNFIISNHMVSMILCRSVKKTTFSMPMTISSPRSARKSTSSRRDYTSTNFP